MSHESARKIGESSPRLSSAESRELTAVLAELTGAQLPLAAGLRAAAEEASSRRLARALRGMAGRLEAGRSLEDVLREGASALPPHVAGVMQAGLRTGRMESVLAELFEQERSAEDLRRSVVGALAYPAVLVAAALGLYTFFSLVLVRPFAQIFEEFELKLAPLTIAALWVGTTGIWLVLGALSAFLVALVALRLILGSARWQIVFSYAPLVGPIWHWSAVAEATRLLALLMEHEVPLPEALRLTAQGVKNADISQACGALARNAESGQPLYQLFAESARLPPFLAPVVGWGESTGALAAALRAVGDAFESRARRRSEVFRVALSPFVFLLVLCSVGFLMVGIFIPLVSLITGLSGF